MPLPGKTPMEHQESHTCAIEQWIRVKLLKNNWTIWQQMFTFLTRQLYTLTFRMQMRHMFNADNIMVPVHPAFLLLSVFLCTSQSGLWVTQALTWTLDAHQAGNLSQAESHINSILEPDEVAATQHINNTLLPRPAELRAAFFKPTLLANQRYIH